MGTVSPSLIRAIGRWVEEHQLWVLSDEIYEHLVYDGVETGSVPVLCPELADRCVVLSEEHRVVAEGPPDELLADRELLLSVNLIHERSPLIERGA